MINELIDVTNALIFALKIDGRKDKANTELIAEAERIVKLCNLQNVTNRRELLKGFIKWEKYNSVRNTYRTDEEITNDYLKTL